MNKALFAVVPLVAVLLPVLQAAAEDVYDPPWDSTYPTNTYQVWEFLDPTGNPAYPEIDENPYGEPWLVFEGTDQGLDGVEWVEEPGPREGETTTGWHIADPAGGKITITVFNDPKPGIFKEVFIQLTSTKTPPPGGVTGSPPGTTTSPFPHTQWPVDNWYTYNYLMTIPDNPAVETITIELPYSTIVGEIVVSTRCVPIPEPGLLALSGLGLLVFLRKRK
jgi:hypothetical protein